jgi:hypothetical protein
MGRARTHARSPPYKHFTHVHASRTHLQHQLVDLLHVVTWQGQGTLDMGSLSRLALAPGEGVRKVQGGQLLVPATASQTCATHRSRWKRSHTEEKKKKKKTRHRCCGNGRSTTEMSRGTVTPTPLNQSFPNSPIISPSQTLSCT